jgi:hypothetical protein
VCLVATDCLASCLPYFCHTIFSLSHLSPTVHARGKHDGHDLGADIVQGLGNNAHRMTWGGGIGVLKGDGEGDALAGKDGLALTPIPKLTLISALAGFGKPRC